MLQHREWAELESALKKTSFMFSVTVNVNFNRINHGNFIFGFVVLRIYPSVFPRSISKEELVKVTNTQGLQSLISATIHAVWWDDL